MLNFLRKAAKTWVFKGLFALLILSFAVWGAGDINFTGAGTRVATVGDESISVGDYGDALAREMTTLSQRAQRRVTVEEAQAAGLPVILLQRMVREAVLDAEASALGLSAADGDVRRAIKTSDSFNGVDGKFSEEQYRFIIDRLGWRPEEFEANMRRALARDVLNYAVAGGARSAPGIVEKMAEHAMETRRIAVIALTPDQAEAPEAPEEAVLKAYIEENQAAYMKPETRAVRWVAIDPAKLAEQIEIPEAELKTLYEEQKDRFTTPEVRAVDQLSFDDAAAAEAALAKIKAGETSFAALMEERGVTAEDVALGTGPAAGFPSAVAEAAFALEAPGVAGPVDLGFGPILVRVTEIRAGGTETYEKAAPILKRERALELAEDRAVAMAEEMADILASGAGLKGIAADLGLKVHAAPALPQGGDEAAGPFAGDVIFASEAWDAAVGQERDVIETTGGGFVLMMVDGIDPEAPLPFEAAKEAAEAAWLKARRIDALEETAKAAVEKLSAGAAPAEVAAELGVEVKEVGPIRRDGGVGEIDAYLLEKMFAAETGGADMQRTAEGVAIGVLLEVIAADLKDATLAMQIERLRAQYDQATAADLQAYYAAAAQTRAGVTFNQEAMDQAINRLR